MVSELAHHECDIIEPFFTGPEFDLLLSSIQEGNSPAQIWVDDTSRLNSVFMWDKANNVFYLSGDEKNHHFNDEVAMLLNRQVIPNLRFKHRTQFRLRTSSQAWSNQVPTIFKNVGLRKGQYAFFTYRGQVKLEWEDKIPVHFKLLPIDRNVLYPSQYENAEAVNHEIRNMWPSIPRFLEYGFGYVLITHKTIVSWCTSEYVSRYKCGIGIETLREYQNRGLATLLASAFVDHSQRKHVEPFWECNVENLASRRVAEKVGFVKEYSYPTYFGRLQ